MQKSPALMTLQPENLPNFYYESGWNLTQFLHCILFWKSSTIEENILIYRAMPKLNLSPQFQQFCCMPLTCTLYLEPTSWEPKRRSQEHSLLLQNFLSIFSELLLTCLSHPCLASLLLCSLTHTPSVRFLAHPLLPFIRLHYFSPSNPSHPPQADLS